MSNFRWGLIALVDALGFKGIYRQHDPEQVLTQMKQIEDDLRAEFEAYRDSNRILLSSAMGIRFLSDAVAISLQTPHTHQHEVDPKDARFACFTLCQLVLELTNLWALSPIKLTFRGAIGIGRYCAAGNYLVGEAIDQAAQLHSEPDGAFICLSRETQEFLFEPKINVKSSEVLLAWLEVCRCGASAS